MGEYLQQCLTQLAHFFENYFRAKTNIPVDIHFRKPFSDDEVLGDVGEGEVAVRVSALLKGGLTLPFSDWVASFFQAFQIAPCQLTLNSYQILNGVKRLSDFARVKLEMKDIFGVYSLHFDTMSYYLKSVRSFAWLVLDIPEMNKEHNFDSLIMSGTGALLAILFLVLHLWLPLLLPLGFLMLQNF